MTALKRNDADAADATWPDGAAPQVVHEVDVMHGAAMHEAGRRGAARHESATASPGTLGLRANEFIAERLREAAQLLDDQNANPFRIKAYRHAADKIEHLERDVRPLFEQGGIDALEEIDGVGPGIAAAMGDMLVSGRWSLLDRLRGQAQPELLFRVVPGIGRELALRIHDALHVDTLEGLEIAAYDGRLASVPGVGPRRTAAIRAALAALLTRRRGRFTPEGGPVPQPPVGVLLDVDREYLHKAAQGRLPTISPRRFNRDGTVLLPIACPARRVAFHRAVLECGARTCAAAHALLGRRVLLQRCARRAAMHDRHRAPRPAGRAARRARPRGRVQGALRCGGGTRARTCAGIAMILRVADSYDQRAWHGVVIRARFARPD